MTSDDHSYGQLDRICWMLWMCCVVLCWQCMRSLVVRGASASLAAPLGNRLAYSISYFSHNITPRGACDSEDCVEPSTPEPVV